MDAITIFTAETPKQLEDTRGLLLEYGQLRDFDEALGDFDKELRELPGEYASPEGCLLIAYYDNTPAGCVAIRKIDTQVCEMKRLYVSEKFRGKQLGMELAAAIIKLAGALGYRKIRLDTHPWMEAARSLYLQLGFREIEAYHNNPVKGVKYFELRFS